MANDDDNINLQIWINYPLTIFVENVETHILLFCFGFSGFNIEWYTPNLKSSILQKLKDDDSQKRRTTCTWSWTVLDIFSHVERGESFLL